VIGEVSGGGWLTKDEVRRLAEKVGLKVAGKKESQEICFIEGDYGEFISDRLGQVAAKVEAGAGDMVDSAGKIVGRHKGLFRYTIGQRRGLDIKDGSGPYYVLGMDMADNRLIVGTGGELFSKGLIVRELSWVSGVLPSHPELCVKIRYRHQGVSATIKTLDDGSLSVVFNEPQRSVTPGQAVVFYDGDEVLGGGWIEQAIK